LVAARDHVYGLHEQGKLKMAKIGTLFILVIFSVILFLIIGCKPNILDRTVPEIVNGVLDLSDWDFDKDGPVELSGKWEFYWKAHLMQEDFTDENPSAMSGVIKVPGTWNGFEVNGEKISAEGYATYRLRILLGDTRRHRLAFKFLDMAVAYSVYVNGKKLLSAGRPGKTFESTIPQFYPQVVNFQPASERLDVIIQVSNFHHRKGGAWEPILLGLAEDMRQIRQRALNVNFFLFGGILIMGIYHIGLFIFRREEKSTLFFGIFCFLIAARSLVTGERYLIHLFPEFNWEVHTKIAYLTFYIGVPVFAVYTRNIFPKEISKYAIYAVSIAGAIFSAIVLFTPARIYTYTAALFQIFTIAAAGYGLFSLIPAIQHKRQGALIYLSGFVIIFLTLVNDILYSNLLVQTGYMLPFGLFGFILCQVCLLSLRFSKAFITIESQRQSLQEINSDYKKEILEHKRSEEALRESEEKYRLLVENASEAIVVAQDGVLRFVNSRATEFSGYSAEESKSNPFIQIVHPEDRDEVDKNYMNRINGKAAPARYTFRAMHKDNSVRWVEISAVRISWEDAPATLNFLSDITEKRRLEEELVNARQLESIGVLAGGIAHDFNNILGAIMGNISLAKLDVDLGDTMYNLLNEAEKALKRATALTHQLLTFSKGGAPVKQVTPIGNVIMDCSAFALSGSRVRSDFSLPTDLWPVEIDVGQISQVIHNIIINAVQAMPDAGVIQVSAENITVDTNRGLPLPPGRYVKIAFKDPGTGIPDAELPKIFDPYFTSRPERNGLGLTTAYSIIKRHEGHITVQSQVEVGTIFDVYLPAAGDATPKTMKETPRAFTGTGKILAMDDDEMIRDLLQQMLLRIGYTVEVARDGNEAIELYRRAMDSGDPFDVVILDLTVPGAMGGKEAIDRLRQMDASVKAIVSSGYSNDPIMSDYQKHGFSGVVAKPFNIQALGKTIAELLAKVQDIT
jgi:PAS domain S-box-containing protein